MREATYKIHDDSARRQGFRLGEDPDDLEEGPVLHLLFLRHVVALDVALYLAEKALRGSVPELKRFPEDFLDIWVREKHVLLGIWNGLDSHTRIDSRQLRESNPCVSVAARVVGRHLSVRGSFAVDAQVVDEDVDLVRPLVRRNELDLSPVTIILVIVPDLCNTGGACAGAIRWEKPVQSRVSMCAAHRT